MTVWKGCPQSMGCQVEMTGKQPFVVLGPNRSVGSSYPESWSFPGATHQCPPPLEGTDEGPQSPQQVGLNEEEQGEVDAP
jgi:hypothetical protein